MGSNFPYCERQKFNQSLNWFRWDSAEKVWVVIKSGLLGWLKEVVSPLEWRAMFALLWNIGLRVLKLYNLQQKKTKHLATQWPMDSSLMEFIIHRRILHSSLPCSAIQRHINNLNESWFILGFILFIMKQKQVPFKSENIAYNLMLTNGGILLSINKMTCIYIFIIVFLLNMILW